MFFLFLNLNVFLIPRPMFVGASGEKGKHQRKLPAGTRAARAARILYRRAKTTTRRYGDRLLSLLSLPPFFKTEGSFLTGGIFQISIGDISQGTLRRSLSAPSHPSQCTPRISSKQINTKADKQEPQESANRCAAKNRFIFAGSCYWFFYLLKNCHQLSPIKKFRQRILAPVTRLNSPLGNCLNLTCKKAIAVFQRFAFFQRIIEVDKREPQSPIGLSKRALRQTKPFSRFAKGEKFILLRHQQVPRYLLGNRFELAFFQHLDLNLAVSGGATASTGARSRPSRSLGNLWEPGAQRWELNPLGTRSRWFLLFISLRFPLTQTLDDKLKTGSRLVLNCFFIHIKEKKSGVIVFELHIHLFRFLIIHLII
jgi:hypothetical protein